MRCGLSLMKVFTLLLLITVAVETAAGQENTALKIIVLEGEGAFNNIRRRLARDLTVEVRDEENLPVRGARVEFELPEVGPGGVFPGGVRNFVATTDIHGRASSTGLRPNSTEGRFRIRVTASLAGKTGTAVVSQSNTLAGGVITGVNQGRSKKKWAILLGVAAGAAGGIYAGTRSETPVLSPPRPTVLSAGAVSAGGPR